MNGQQGGDPAKLATALIQLTGQDEPPLRWAAGADAVGVGVGVGVGVVEQKAHTLLDQVDPHRELSSSLGHDDASTWLLRRLARGSTGAVARPGERLVRALRTSFARRRARSSPLPAGP
jgi:hypothetical protein